MLILIGTVPTAYALNRAMPADQMTQFVAVAQVAQSALQPHAAPAPLAPARRRAQVADRPSCARKRLTARRGAGAGRR